MDKKPPLEDEQITHGICSICYTQYSAQMEGLSFDQYLEGFDAPLFITNDSGRIVAANKRAAALVGKSEPEFSGLLGGEVFECKYARLPEGCGNTIHCSACTIRKTVENTLRTKQAQLRQPVWIRQDDKQVEMVISTDYKNGFVRIVVEATTCAIGKHISAD